LRGGIVASGRDSGGLGGIVVSGRDSGGLRGIVASRRDSCGEGGGIEGFRCNLGGLGGSIDGSGRDSRGLGERIEGFRCVSAFVGPAARLLDRTLGSNSCKAFLFFDWSRQGMQVLKTLLPRSAEALAKKEESRSFLMQVEQYFKAIPDVKAAES
jgi:hypothetical protein